MGGKEEPSWVEFVIDLDGGDPSEWASIEVDAIEDAEARCSVRWAAQHFLSEKDDAHICESDVVEDLMRCYAFADHQLARIRKHVDVTDELAREAAQRAATEEKLSKICSASQKCLSRFERALEYERCHAVSYSQYTERCGAAFVMCMTYLHKIHVRMEEVAEEMERLHPRFVGGDVVYDDILERRRQDRLALLKERHPKKPTWDIDI